MDESDEDEEQHAEGISNDRTNILQNEEEIPVDNLESWKNVERILANPELHHIDGQYLSQFINGAGSGDVEKEDNETCNLMDKKEEETEEKEVKDFEIKNVTKAESTSIGQPLTSSSSTNTPIVAMPKSCTSDQKQEEEEQGEGNSTSGISQSQQPPELQPSPTLPSPSTSSIFPSFVQVTYPDPVTNRFTSDRPAIQVAAKYTPLAETKKAKDCPDVEPLFVDQPLARVRIDYVAMRETRTEVDEVTEECEELLAREEASTLKNYENYAKEMNKMYAEQNVAERLQERPTVLPWTGLETRRGIEKAEREGFSPQINLDKLFTEVNRSNPGNNISELLGSNCNLDNGGESLNSFTDGGVRELPKDGIMTDKVATVSNDKWKDLPFNNQFELFPTNSLSETPLNTLTEGLPDLKQNDTTNNEDKVHQQSSPLNTSVDTSWIFNYLNSPDNFLETPEITDTMRQQRTAEIRKANEKIVERIKRMYEGENWENEGIKQNPGPFKEPLQDSLPLKTPGHPLAIENTKDSTLTASTTPPLSSVSNGNCERYKLLPVTESTPSTGRHSQANDELDEEDATSDRSSNAACAVCEQNSSTIAEKKEKNQE